MHRIDRLIVGVTLTAGRDALTPGSRRAVEQAQSLAPVLGARVTLVHSTAADEVWDRKIGDYLLVSGDLPGQGRTVLEGVIEELRRAELSAELSLTGEKAWLAIIRRVLAGEAGLVVTGKRNETQRSAPPIGSVSSKLVRKCPGPVWVAKTEGAIPPRRILAATDLGPVGERVVEWAAFVARHFQSELHLVHALQMPLSVQFEDAEDSWAAEQRERAIGVLRKQLEAAGYGAAAEFHVGVTAPTRAILECNARVDPDLVVMGTVSRGGVAGVLVGNTAERLLERLDCSLLVVKPADFVCPVTAA